jgi:hypothetical protein
MRHVFLVAVCLAGLLPQAARAERKEIVIGAAELAAQGQAADKPTPGKWWLKRDATDWGAPGGTILMTGESGEKKSEKAGEWIVPPAHLFVPYRVPALVVDPRASGWYRIHVGLYHEALDPLVRPQLLARLSGEAYGEYLRAPPSTSERTTEVYWKAADLTGRKIRLEQPPAPMPHPGFGWRAGVTQIRLVPMTEAEVQESRKEIELPPSERRLFGMLDYTDEVFWWGTLESEDDVRAIVYRHGQAGFGRVYWRAFGSHLDNSVALPEAAARWSDDDEKRWCKQQNCQAGWKAYIDLTRKFDPLKVAVEYGSKNGVEVHAWVRFTNFNREPYANFWHDHPEFAVQMLATTKDPKTGAPVPLQPYRKSAYRRVLSLAYPEVRAFYVKFFKEIAGTGTRGILIDLLRHPPIVGYEPIVADAFKKKYGTDLEERDIYHDPLVQEFISEYLRLFLVELRKEVGKEVEIAVRSSGPSKYALRGKQWIEDGLIDTIIDGNWYSGNGPRPTIDETVAAVGKRGRAFAIAESYDVDPKNGWKKRNGDLSADAILALTKNYSGRGAAHFGLYESTVFTWHPELRRAVREAGWAFDPSRNSKDKDR